MFQSVGDAETGTSKEGSETRFDVVFDILFFLKSLSFPSAKVQWPSC
jgi:hypothetical protein